MTYSRPSIENSKPSSQKAGRLTQPNGCVKQYEKDLAKMKPPKLILTRHNSTCLIAPKAMSLAAAEIFSGIPKSDLERAARRYRDSKGNEGLRTYIKKDRARKVSACNQGARLVTPEDLEDYFKREFGADDGSILPPTQPTQ
jgi:hypothetical protein